jgi:hypothetical protein
MTQRVISMMSLNVACDEATRDGENDMEMMGAEAADQFKSLVAQRVLSVQFSQAEHQCHNLFQIRGIVKDPAIRIIIDGWSCKNLASIGMVEKLALPTQQHSHPYYIQWF